MRLPRFARNDGTFELVNDGTFELVNDGAFELIRASLNDGVYDAFWELRFKGHLRYPVRSYRGHSLLEGEEKSFRLFGPTCDSTDEMPASVRLPADIEVGDYIEFGTTGAYSLSGRTRFNGFYSDDVITIGSEDSVPRNKMSW